MAESDERRHDAWTAGDLYEPYVGRWSRLVAREFVDWLALPAGIDWLDVGCGTGALSQAIVERADPRSLRGIDASPAFLAGARRSVSDSRARFDTGDARSLPFEARSVDAAVSGLALNFVPEAAAELARVVRPGGCVAAYVWDYAEGMELMRHFWDAAVALDPAARDLDEGVRFPICRPEPLAMLFSGVPLAGVETRAIDVPTVFRDFDDYWTPFLGGQAPAPGYCLSLSAERRDALREQIRARLPCRADGVIPLVARAWAVRGLRMGD
jgi:SAM-dependent methyltransferase